MGFHTRIATRLFVVLALCSATFAMVRAAPRTPIDVELSLSAAPALNQPATATILVRSSQDAPGTSLELILPPGAVASAFHVRDVSFGEDRCRVRTGNAPQALAHLRDKAISTIRKRGLQMRPTREAFAANPKAAIRAILRS